MFAGAIELAKLLIPIAIATAIGCALVAGAIGAFDYWFDPKIKIGERLQASANLVGAALGGILGAGGAIVAFIMGRAHEKKAIEAEQRDLSRIAFEHAIWFQVIVCIQTLENHLPNYDPADPATLANAIDGSIDETLVFDIDYQGEVTRKLRAEWSSFKTTRTMYERLGAAASVLYVDVAMIPIDIRMNKHDHGAAIALLESIQGFCACASDLLNLMKWLPGRASVVARANDLAALAANKAAATQRIHHEKIIRSMPPDPRI